MLQKCLEESTLSRTQVFEWHKAFSFGRYKWPFRCCIDFIEKLSTFRLVLVLIKTTKEYFTLLFVRRNEEKLQT